MNNNFTALIIYFYHKLLFIVNFAIIHVSVTDFISRIFNIVYDTYLCLFCISFSSIFCMLSL
jgi:hypothetical protein